MKIFEFNHSEGSEVIAAGNAKEAIMFYFTHYQDDINTDVICEENYGIKIRELKGEKTTKKHRVYDEESDKVIETSYKKLGVKYYNGKPTILVTPNY